MGDFPVLMSPANWRRYPDCPKSVPWAVVAPHAARAGRNHGQTLETLARRGGLGPDELRATLEDDPLDFGIHSDELPAAVAWLTALLAPTP